MAGRTTWRAKPCGWRDRERTVALGEEFGPAGPLVLDVLEELAKEQNGDGDVRTGLRSLARAAFLPRGTEGLDLVRQILRFASQVRAVDELAIGDDSDMTVTCRVSGFAADQGRGYESVRKSQQRAGHRPDDGDNGGACPEDGDSVPVCPPTGQDRTGQRTASSTQSADGTDLGEQDERADEAVVDDLDAARRRLRGEQVERIAATYLDVKRQTLGARAGSGWKLTPERRALIARRLDEYGEEDVLDAVRGWRHSPHHRGDNDQGTVYADLELILDVSRKRNNVERFRDLERRHGRRNGGAGPPIAQRALPPDPDREAS